MFKRRRKQQDFNAEIEAHVRLEADRLRQEGLSEDEAQYAALRAFGNVTRARETFSESGHRLFWDHLWRDIRVGLRTLGRSRSFTVVAVLTLALGIGASTAIFSIVYASLVKPLPFRNADRIVFIRKENPLRGWTHNPISMAEFTIWRDQSRSFEDMAAYRQTSCVLTGAGEPEQDPCHIVASNLFPLLGVAPIIGRNLSPEEDREKGPLTAILSYGLWKRRFGGEASVIGRSLTLNGRNAVIVGVMPDGFSPMYASPYGPIPELWISGIGPSPTQTWNDYFAVGRLKPGVSPKRAAAELEPASEEIGRAYPDLKGWRPEFTSLREILSGDTSSILLILMGAVTFVLLIACANVANLMLARGASRTNELAVRKALGAGQGRLVRQLLIESLLLSLAGGICGIFLAWWSGNGLVKLAPEVLVRSAPGWANGLDWRVLGYAIATALATTVIFGLAPAIQGARSSLSDALKETSRSAMEAPRSRRFRNMLVIWEVALAVVLLVGAGLMVRTLVEINRVNPGFNPSNVLTLRLPLSGDRYAKHEAIAEFWRRVVPAIASLPGVESASAARGLPIRDWAGQFFTTSEQPVPPAGQVPDANYIVAGPDYFRTLQIPLRSGRWFNENDNPTGEKVVIVNEELARRYWPGENPLGKQLRMGTGASAGPWLSVVGVAGNVLSWGVGRGFHPEVYVSWQQYPWVMRPEQLVVRTAPSVNPSSVIGAVMREVHRIDKDLPASDIRTMEELELSWVSSARMVMALLMAFAGLALALSAMGIYSVLSYSVAQRTREMGMRMALGAQPGDVMRLVVGAGARLALLGIVAGMAAALAMTKLMTGLIYGVRATDPVAFASAVAVLSATILIACYVPARRATKIDPIVALRHD